MHLHLEPGHLEGEGGLDLFNFKCFLDRHYFLLADPNGFFWGFLSGNFCNFVFLRFLFSTGVEDF